MAAAVKEKVEGKVQASKKKSKTALFWEKFPNGIGYIVDHKAVLK